MKRTTAIALAALTAVFVGVFAYAQPVPPGGLRSVTHNSEMTGTGTSLSPLGLITSCSSTQVLAWNGSAWACSNASGLLSGVIQASTVTGTQNDFTISATTTVLRWNGASNVTFTGFTGGADGRILLIENITGVNLVFSAESGSSSAANRLWLSGPSNQIVLNSLAGNPNSFATFVYDGTSSRWRLQGFNSQRVDAGMEWVQAGQFDGALAVAGLATLTGGFTSATASTMTAPLTVQDFRGTEISPAGITGATNDWAPTGLSTATTIFVTSSSGAILLNGLTGGANGRRIVIVNADAAQNLTVRHENTGSTAANRIDTFYNDDIMLPAAVNASVTMEYWSSRWHVTSAGTYAFGPNALTNNRLAKGSSTYLANSLWADDGTTSTYNTTAFSVNTTGNTVALGFGDFKSGVYGGNGSLTDTVYITQDRLGYAYGTNAAALGKINSVGYLEGATQFRELEILDGKGGAIAAFANASDVAMPNDAHQFTNTGYLNKFDLSVLGNTTLGDAATDSITFSNGPSGINRYDGKHIEWAEDWLIGSGPNTNASPYDNYVLQFSGTGTGTAAVTGVSGHPGVMALTTGVATAGGYATMTTDPNTVYFGDGNWTYEWRGGWPTLSSSSNSVASMYVTEVGFTDSPTTPNVVDGCYFAYDKGNILTGGVNGTNLDRLECWCASNSTRTGYLMNGAGNSDESFALGTATVAAMTYPNTNNLGLKIIVTGTTRAEFYVDSGGGLTKRCDINTNLPSTTSRLTGFGVGQFPEASTGTGARTVNTDYTRAQLDFTTARTQ